MTRQLHLINSMETDLRWVKPSEVVREATTYIDSPEKWAQGNFHVGAGSCALGALISSSQTGRMALRTEQYNALMTTMKTVFKESFPDVQAEEISDFNDDPSITWEDIVSAFEKTAVRLEEVGQ